MEMSRRSSISMIMSITCAESRPSSLAMWVLPCTLPMSGAAWENVFILKQVMEEQKIMAKADTVQADREKIRVGLAKLAQTQGLLGITKRTDDREAVKPYLFVHAKGGKWEVLHTP